MRAFRRSMHYFEVVARTSSIRAAAEILHIAPSALSRTVQQLEAEVGVPLFDRTAKGLQLTAAGETVLGYMYRWKRESDQLADDVRSLTGSRLETVRIASVEVGSYEVVPQAISVVRQLRPGLSVALFVGHTQAVLESMLNGSSDIGVIIHMPNKAPVRSLWTTSNPVGLAVPRNHRFARRRSITLAECLNDPIILPDESLMSRSAIRIALQGAGPYRTAGSSNRIVAIKSMLRAGLGVTFLSQLDVTKEERSGAFSFVPLSDPSIEHPFVSVIAPKAVRRSAAVDSVIEALKQILPSNEFNG